MIQKKETYATAFLILFFLVGIAGFLIPETRLFFVQLTPLALLLSAVVLILFHAPRMDLGIAAIFLIIFFISFMAEAIGVSTGVIFGEYTYGKGLGIKILKTPVLIGLNWFMLVYCTKVIADRISSNKTVRLLVAPLLMVGYDLLLEQAAPLLDMWSWAGGKIPPQNYAAWFLLAFLFHLLIRKYTPDFKNPLAAPVFIIQFLFFGTIVIFFAFNNS